MGIQKIAEELLAIGFLFLGASTVSAVVMVNFAFMFKLVYRFIKKASENEDH